MLNRISVPEPSIQNAARAAIGVKRVDSRGKTPVSAAAKASSARAIRTKTGTTGANGAAASRIIPIAISRFNPRAAAAPTTRAGMIVKLTSTIEKNRHCASAALTSS